jgi:serine phosphatase RsbU (regulator of sigma subunit)/pSer/pThr/pTyr-binding forkhead associated (FHA) protein
MVAYSWRAMAYLRYIDDSGQLQTKVLDSEHFLIGRAPTCQLVIESDMISREHVRIDLEQDGRYRVRDLGSRNKTYVNGELIAETLLTPGAIIRFGDRIVEFVDDSAAAEQIDLEFLTPDRTEPPDCDWLKINPPLSLTISQIEQLSQLHGDQALTARPEDIANTVLGRIVLDLQGERGLIALRGEAKMELHPLAHRSLKRPTGASMTPVSQSFIFAPLLQGVAGRYPQTAGQMSTKLGYAVTALVAPLISHGEVVGVLYVDRPAAKKPFTGAALQYCTAAGALIGAQLAESSRRVARSAAREGATWMSTIRRLQATLTTPVVSSDSFDAAAKCYPGRLRCGDFGAVVHIDEQRCAILVIDGGGHGITGIAQSNGIRLAVQTGLAASEDALLDPAPLFNTINRQVASSKGRQILPCVFVGIDMSSGKLAYINAGGMPPLLMVAPGRLLTLDQVSLVLGVDADYIYQATSADLPERFRVVCYTDGLTEAVSAAGQSFGDQRLHETLLEREAFGSATEVLAAIGHAWTTHLATAQTADDAYILVVARG